MTKKIRAEEIVGNFTHVEDWHEVGTSGEPEFENSWVNIDTTRAARFYKDPFGIVHLAGMINTGTANTIAFTLPSGYFPDYTGSTTPQHFVADLAARVVITDAGEVRPVSYTSYVSLDGITFRAA